MKQIQETSARTVESWMKADEAVLIDVREAEELAQARVPGAIHIPMSAFNPELMPEEEDKKIVFMCAAGMRSMQVGQYLLENDMLDAAYNLTDGIQGWAMAGLPIETG